MIGILEKQFTLAKDRFQMDIAEGTLKLEEYAGSTKRHCSFDVIDHISLAILQIKLLTGQFEIFRKGSYCI